MNIKKQIILDDKDYERLVHDANLSNDEIKSKIASALTTDIVVSFDFDVNKKVTGNMRIESATHNLGYNEYDNIVRARDENIHHAVYTAIYDYLEKIWFYPNCMDVYVMVTPFLMGVRNDMENFKLMTVARTMGIEIDENKLHDATYDIELTRDIFYKIINKMDVKL